MRLMLVEDDKKLADHLVTNLRENGFLVTHYMSEEDILNSLDSNEKYDIIVLDRLLGRSDSKSSLPKLKRKWPDAPILTLSAISTPNERTDMLNLGSDDYLGKPFSTQELLARLRALLRRTSTPPSTYIQVGDLVVDTVRRTASNGSKSISLPGKEFLLLRILAQESQKVWSKASLLDYVWGHAADIDTNVLESTINNLRKKMSDLETTVLIRNMRNVGYWIES